MLPATKSQAENGVDNKTYMTPLRTKQAIQANKSGGGSGTSNYNDLDGKPKINNVTLEGNKTTQELGITGNVQADWSVEDKTSGAYIKNKPNVPSKTSDLINDSNFVSDANYVHTDNNYTTTEKNKLSKIASGAEVNVQSDWSQSDNTKDDYIKNKPTIPTVNNGTFTIQKNGNNIQTFSANQSTNATANITVPTKTSDLINDSGYITNYTETDPIFTASPAHKITDKDITNWNNKSNFSGSYNDLTDKPVIPTVPTNVGAFTNDVGYLTEETDPTVPSHVKNITQNDITAWNEKQNALVSGTNIKTINNQSVLGEGNLDIDVSVEETDPIFTQSVAATIDDEDIGYWNDKQEQLVSGTNIKTINGYSVLGGGNIIIGEGGVVATDVEINGATITSNGSANIIADGVYDPETNKIATESTVKRAIGNLIDYVYYREEIFENPILGTSAIEGVVTVGKEDNPIQFKLGQNVAKIILNNADTVYVGTDNNGKTRIYANNMNALQSIKLGDFSWNKLSDGSIVFGGDE